MKIPPLGDRSLLMRRSGTNSRCERDQRKRAADGLPARFARLDGATRVARRVRMEPRIGMWSVVSSNPVLVFFAVLGALLVTSDLGFRLGRRQRATADDATRSLVGATCASFLGLLALLLGFAFAFAAGRYNSRCDVVMREANAIATAYRSAGLLPEPQRSEIREMLRRYVADRMRVYELGTEAAAAAARECGTLQGALWARVVTAATGKEIQPVIAGTVLATFNAAFNSSEEALVAFENSLPSSILGLLSIVAAISAAVTGYSDGLSRKRMLLLVVVQPILVALVIATIHDLDRPFRGVVRVSRASLTRAAGGMR
jgi:hypothetical protein